MMGKTAGKKNKGDKKKRFKGYALFYIYLLLLAPCLTEALSERLIPNKKYRSTEYRKYVWSSKSGEIPGVSTIFSLSVENEQADAGRDGFGRLVPCQPAHLPHSG